VAPGDITITLSNTNGTVLATTTANVNGDGFFNITTPAPVSFHVNANTSVNGFYNLPNTVDITLNINGNACVPASVSTPLCPDTLYITDSVQGTNTAVHPYGGPFPGVAGGTPVHYVGASNTNFVNPMASDCNCNSVTSLPIYAAYFTLCSLNSNQVTIQYPYNASSGTFCPVSNSNTTGLVVATTTVNTGNGPGGNSCYPVNLSGNGQMTACFGFPTNATVTVSQ
jgi:hypothetical protein